MAGDLTPTGARRGRFEATRTEPVGSPEREVAETRLLRAPEVRLHGSPGADELDRPGAVPDPGQLIAGERGVLG